MQTAFDTGTRLSVAQDILTGLVLQYQGWVRFAYEEFPAPEGCASSGACCAGDPTNPMLSASNSITYAMHACERSPGGCALSADRPIAAALDQSRQVFYTNFDAGVRGRYIVLVTDGDPSCFADSDTLECSNANASAVSLVNDNIKTFVVGEAISNSSCLDQLALSGGAERQGGAPFFYPAGTKSQLSEFLTDIISQIASDACQIDVHQPSDPTSQLALYLKGIQIPRDDTNGWDFDASTPWKITINGSWCQMLLAASPSQLEIDACPQH